MSDKKKLKGSWSQRAFVFLLSVVFGVLLYWILGFLTHDLGTIRGPELSAIEKKYVEHHLLEKQKYLNEQIANFNRTKQNMHQQRQLLKDSTDNLQNTIRQLLDIQKQSIEKNLDFPQKSSETLAKNQIQFLENQKEYQALNNRIVDLTTTVQDRERKLADLKKQIDTQKKTAREEFDQLRKKHRLKVAAFKLAFLIPVFLIASWFFAKKRTSAYSPMVYAGFISPFIKIAEVAHEHFPTKYFKYIAILVVMGIVTKILVSLLKKVASPKKNWLIKQYQESYDRYICPVCRKPMKIGPLRYTTSKKSFSLTAQKDMIGQEPYTCPSCGTNLYQKCDKCSNVCHSLLPFCEHCGYEKSIERV